MIMEFDRNAPAWTLTVGDVYDIIHKAIGQTKQKVEVKNYSEGNYSYGLNEFARFLKKSKTTAWKMVHSGKIDPAISRYKNQLIIDNNMVIDLLKINHKKK